MTIHYHGTPITPMTALYELAGRCFCVSHARPDQVKLVHQIGQSVLLDNGAFTKFTQNRATNWGEYHRWVEEWLAFPTTWAVIPDEIAAGSQEQDALIREWPHGQRGAPVWHSSEPLDRLYRLCDEWPRVCIGFTDEHWQVFSDAWRRRMDETFDGLAVRHRWWPWVHGFRAMQLVGGCYPFASLDSTDIARNHNREQNTPRKMADRWDAVQCPAIWNVSAKQTELAM